MHVACLLGHSDVALYLLQRGASIENGGLSMTPLHFAVLGGKVETCKELIRERLQIQAEDALGRTPITMADEWMGSHLNDLVKLQTDLAIRDLKDRAHQDNRELTGAIDVSENVFDALDKISKFTSGNNDENPYVELNEEDEDYDKDMLNFSKMHPLDDQDEETSNNIVVDPVIEKL